MIARPQRGKSGYTHYLLTGDKKDSKYTRDEKDNVVTLYGNLDIFRKTELYLNEEKNFEDNYLMLVISFSKDDINKMNNMSDEDVLAMKKDIVKTYIKHHTSGYDLDNEVIAYAEEHQPKIKIDEKGNERYNHIHIGIALYNPLDDTKLRTTYHNNSFIDDVLQNYINKKYGLSQPREHKRERQGINADTQIAKDRKYYKEALKDIKSNDELIQYFKDNNLKYREVKRNNNHYYKIIVQNSKDINLKGRGFEHIHKVTLDKDFVYNEHKDIEELEKILTSYYEQRVKQIYNRRSKQTKEALEEIYNKKTYNYGLSNNTKLSKNEYKSLTFQQKIFYKHYKSLINNDLKKWYIDTTKDDVTIFKKAAIEIVDKGDIITSNSKTTLPLSVAEEVKTMLDIAEAKGWDIANLDISGSYFFQVESEKQIAERLAKKEDNVISNNDRSVVSSFIKEAKDKDTEKNNKLDFAFLNKNIDKELLLEVLAERFKINHNDYAINGLSIRNKASNQSNQAVYFVKKEFNVSYREAHKICNEVFMKQDKQLNRVADEHHLNINNQAKTTRSLYYIQDDYAIFSSDNIANSKELLKEQNVKFLHSKDRIFIPTDNKLTEEQAKVLAKQYELKDYKLYNKMKADEDIKVNKGDVISVKSIQDKINKAEEIKAQKDQEQQAKQDILNGYVPQKDKDISNGFQKIAISQFNKHHNISDLVDENNESKLILKEENVVYDRDSGRYLTPFDMLNKNGRFEDFNKLDKYCDEKKIKIKEYDEENILKTMEKIKDKAKTKDDFNKQIEKHFKTKLTESNGLILFDNDILDDSFARKIKELQKEIDERISTQKVKEQEKKDEYIEKEIMLKKYFEEGVKKQDKHRNLFEKYKEDRLSKRDIDRVDLKELKELVENKKAEKQEEKVKEQETTSGLSQK